MDTTENKNTNNIAKTAVKETAPKAAFVSKPTFSRGRQGAIGTGPPYGSLARVTPSDLRRHHRRKSTYSVSRTLINSSKSSLIKG